MLDDLMQPSPSTAFVLRLPLATCNTYACAAGGEQHLQGQRLHQGSSKHAASRGAPTAAAHCILASCHCPPASPARPNAYRDLHGAPARGPAHINKHERLVVCRAPGCPVVLAHRRRKRGFKAPAAQAAARRARCSSAAAAAAAMPTLTCCDTGKGRGRGGLGHQAMGRLAAAVPTTGSKLNRTTKQCAFTARAGARAWAASRAVHTPHQQQASKRTHRSGRAPKPGRRGGSRLRRSLTERTRTILEWMAADTQ